MKVLTWEQSNEVNSEDVPVQTEGELHSDTIIHHSAWEKQPHQPHVAAPRRNRYHLSFNRQQITHSPTAPKTNTLQTKNDQKTCMESRRDEKYLLAILFSLLFSLRLSFWRFLLPASCWLARLQTRGTPEIQISWHLFGWTQQAAYASQVTCTQTCNLQIINVVLISHINSCHFVGIVSPRRSPGLLPATTASETARANFSALKREQGVRRKTGRCWLVNTHWHTHCVQKDTQPHANS